MYSLINNSYIYNRFTHPNSFNFTFISKILFSSIHSQPSKQNRLFNSINTLLAKTFPSETQIESQMNLRKQTAIQIKSQIKEISAEEILKYEALIPEWKRKAVVIVDSSSPKLNSKSLKKKTFIPLKILSANPLSRRLSSIFNKSDLKVLMKDFKQSYSNLQYNLKFTGNPIVMLMRDLIEKAHLKSSVSQATEILKKHQTNFDLCVFEKEMKIVLRQLFSLYMNDDSKGIQMICGESAFAMLNSEIKNRKENGVELKYKKPLYIDEPVYQSAEIIDRDNVIMKVKATMQECTMLIDKKTKSIVNKGAIESNVYLMDVIRNPVPFEEEFGHCYMVVNYQKIESTHQLF